MSEKKILAIYTFLLEFISVENDEVNFRINVSESKENKKQIMYEEIKIVKSGQTMEVRLDIRDSQE